MFGWFESKPVLSNHWRDWIDWRFQWLRQEFGDAPLKQPVVIPSEEFFPDKYSATRADVQTLFNRVCKYMQIDSSRVKLRFYNHQGDGQIVQSGYNAAGLYTQDEQGQIVIWLEESQLFNTVRLVATCAHELAHIHLLADGHCNVDEVDHEHLTDLLTVFWGLGIFTANSIRRDKSWISGSLAFTSLEMTGYMKMPEVAYALARCAHFRTEKSPTWMKHLRSDVRADFKYELGDLMAGRRVIWSGSVDARPACMSDLVFQHNLPPGVDVDSTLGSEAQNSESSCPDSPDPNLVPAPHENGQALDRWSNSGSNVANWGQTSDPGHDPSSGDQGFEEGNEFDADHFFTLGIQYNNEARYPEAIEAFTQALQMCPGDSEAYRERAKANLGAGLFEAAIDDATRRLKSESRDDYALRYRAHAQLELGRCLEAIGDLNQIHKADLLPEDYLLRGLAYAGIGDLKRAVSEMTLAINKGPQMADSYLARSRVYAALGEAKLSQLDFDETLHRNFDYTNKDLRDFVPAGRLPIRG